ncbi:MAG: nuclear transport factor 2 family protein [Bacteroidia bacterium]|nr:nuclear transport factor 2 family protein [Bacteroidia bacterium]
MIGAIIARQAVKSGFDALNERNIDKFMKAWGDNCIWIYPGNISISGQFVGKDEVRKWFEKFQDQFPQRKFTLNHLGVGNIFALGGNNIISAQWDLELVNKQGMGFSNSGVTLLTIKGAKVVQGQDFLSNSDNGELKKAWGDV